jgi:hypothetical protein
MVEEVIKIPKKTRKVEEHLEIIEALLAGIILKRTPNVKQVAKIIGVSDNELTELYPRSRKRGDGANEDNEG